MAQRALGGGHPPLRRFDLGVTGGSDYHGANKPGIQLGTGHGGLRVPVAVLEALQERRRAGGLPC